MECSFLYPDNLLILTFCIFHHIENRAYPPDTGAVVNPNAFSDAVLHCNILISCLLKGFLASTKVHQRDVKYCIILLLKAIL